MLTKSHQIQLIVLNKYTNDFSMNTPRITTTITSISLLFSISFACASITCAVSAVVHTPVDVVEPKFIVEFQMNDSFFFLATVIKVNSISVCTFCHFIIFIDIFNLCEF